MVQKPDRREYHVLQHDDRWWVESDDGAVHHSSRDEHDATAWAIRSAEHDHGNGLSTIVCVQQRDGGWKTAYESR